MKHVKTAWMGTSILVLSTAILVSGCGSSGGGSSSSSGSNVSSSSNSSNSSSGGSSGKKITLTMMDYYTTDPTNSEMKNLISQYEKAHPNVTIKRTPIPGNSYLQKVLQEATANALPDVLMLDNPMVPDVASTGVLEPLTKLGSIDKSKFSKGSISEGMYKNSLYAIPADNNTIGLFYNKKLFKQAGISNPPTTWAELKTDAKKLTKNGVYGFAFSGHSGVGNVAWQTEPFFWTAGGNLDKKINSQGTKDTLTFLHSLVKNGSMPQAVVNWNQQDVQNQFQEGKVAMVINGPWIVSSLTKVKGLDYGIATIPVPKQGDKVVSPLGGEVWTVPKHNSATEHAAMKFVKWLFDTKKGQIAFNDVNETIPPYTPAVNSVVSKYPYLKPFATEVQTARARTTYLGSKYPQGVSIWSNAVQSVLTNKMTVDQALKKAQSATQQMMSQ